MKVLIAPLNWGIGHATRSIPLIEHHLKLGHDVFIASSGKALTLLKQRYPTLKHYTLPDYQITYHKGLPVWLSVCLQAGRILNNIRKEHKECLRIYDRNRFNLIISDNRYGVHHPQVHSQFVCHQINPSIPFPIFQKAVERIHRYFCRHFNEILVPDYSIKEHRLSGKLSENQLKWNSQIKYINPLSQLNLDLQSKPNGDDILVLLSGVEPYRSTLEHKVLTQLQYISNKVTIVGGKINDIRKPASSFTYFPFLDKKELEQEINKAKYIICRSGYSTIMDLHQLRSKHIIFIPTPGQTEQEYLAEYLSKTYTFMYKQSEKTMNLKSLIEDISDDN